MGMVLVQNFYYIDPGDWQPSEPHQHQPDTVLSLRCDGGMVTYPLFHAKSKSPNIFQIIG